MNEYNCIPALPYPVKIPETSEKLAKPWVGNRRHSGRRWSITFFLFFLWNSDTSLEIVVFNLWSNLSCTRRILNFVSFNVLNLLKVREVRLRDSYMYILSWSKFRVYNVENLNFTLTHLVINREKAKLVLSWYKPDWKTALKTHCVTLSYRKHVPINTY